MNESTNQPTNKPTNKPTSKPTNQPSTQPPSLYDLDRAALEALLARWGEPRYRARQIWEWLYVHLADTLEQMSNLPQSLRERLGSEVGLAVPQAVDSLVSSDGETRKDLLRLADGETVETVLMHYHRRRTACISTQVGCPVGCPFCATGQAGFVRDLTAGEIVSQALHFARALLARGERLTNVVLMGLGEPLLNYDASVGAIRRLTDPDGLSLGQRHVTLSTAGLVPGIERLAEEASTKDTLPIRPTLAVSLHAATDALRDELVPLNRRYGLDALLEACHGYAARTGSRVSFEWALIRGVNDTPRQAKALAARLAYSGKSRIPRPHVNLIPLNPTGYEGRPSPGAAIAAFAAILERHHVPHTVRLRRGIDIQAGCGQLRQRKE